MSETADTPRKVADRYVRELADLDPSVNTALGLDPDCDGLPDLSPDGLAAEAELGRRTLQALRGLGPDAVADDLERRCATLLAERVGSDLAVHESGEDLRALRNIFSPVHAVRQLFMMMPTETDHEWEVIGRRVARVPLAYRQFIERLEEGHRRGMYAAPRQVRTVVAQLGEWLSGERPWFQGFVASAPDGLADRLQPEGRAADEAVAEVRDYLANTYLPRAEGTPDAVGADRYAIGVRASTGAQMDGAQLRSAYEWGWQEYLRIAEEMRREAERVLPGASPVEAMRYLDQHGEAVEGVEQIRERLQQLMDQAIVDLDGKHFDLAEPVRKVEAMIAPPGSAAAPYYTRPSLDFSRPGRTWLPTMGQTRFPLWGLISTWYHEGVPGHHLQLGQWAYVAPQLSMFQTTIGSVSATTEGWALYAERLMDELGYMAQPGPRLGYLDAQMLRAVRVVIDIGMHLQLQVPADSPIAPGERWNHDLGREFLRAHSGSEDAFIDSEVIRYLGWPGQAISYKLGERAWLAGREEARRRHLARDGEFDLKAWHMAALSLGALGLDDLTTELAAL
ncbi:MAG TPA: DUF885 domain-containing protein [Actinomycetales bacterium]|nr:DUF885 domain-containing protein [Actinomycetales bacterium]